MLSLINLSSSCNDFGCQHVVYHLLMTSLVVMWIGNVSDAHCITQIHSWRRRRLLEVMNLVFHLWIRCWHVNTARNHKKSGTRNVSMFFIDPNELLLLSNVKYVVTDYQAIVSSILMFAVTLIRDWWVFEDTLAAVFLFSGIREMDIVEVSWRVYRFVNVPYDAIYNAD